MFAKAPLLSTVCCLLLAPAVGSAGDANLSVVIVPATAPGGPNLNSQIKKRIEKKLKRDVTVIPFKAYVDAAKQAGIKGNAVFDRAHAAETGTEAGATHVCFIEGQREKKGRKKVYFAEVTLIEVANGGTVFTKRYKLRGRKISGKVAGKMLKELNAALAMWSPPPPVEEEPPPPVEEVVATETTAGPTIALAPEIEVTEPVSTGKSWRPALHFGAGGAVVQRKAELKSAGTRPPGYDGPLPGGYLRLDFYPMAIGGKGSWSEGFGIHVESQYMRVETIVDYTTQASVSSDVIGGNGGLSYRLVFWDSATAPDFVFKAGYGLLIFPLKAGEFPGARYAGPYAGGHFTVPFIEQVALIAGGTCTFMVQRDGKLKKLGRYQSGLGFRAEGGVRLFFDPFELVALFRFEQWSTSYGGTTDLPDSLSQYEDVSLTDRMYGGVFTAGVAF